MSIRISDPLFLLSAQTGLSVGELAASAAKGNPDVNTPQKALKTGESIPIVFCRRRNNNGGVLIQPKMSEGSFSNPIIEETLTLDNGVTTSPFPVQVVRIKYLLVVSEGNLPQLQIRDLFYGNSRRGTFNQAYSGRAGTWNPGNTIDEHFDYVIEKDVNGFYNFNYIVEDSYMNQCGELAQGASGRINKSGPNPEEYSEHGFYQDSNGKWFFLMTRCKHFNGKAYGYEFGWRRKSSGGVNAVIRLYFGKPIEKVN